VRKGLDDKCNQVDSESADNRFISETTFELVLPVVFQEDLDQFHESSEYLIDSTMDDDGNVVMIGTFSLSPKDGENTADRRREGIFVAKSDSLGNVLWQRSYTTTEIALGNNFFYSFLFFSKVTLQPDGIYLSANSGTWFFDSEGVFQFQVQYPDHDRAISSGISDDDGFFYGNGDEGVFKVSRNGNLQWFTEHSFSEYRARSEVVINGNAVYTINRGTNDDYLTADVSKFNGSTGERLWTRIINTPGDSTSSPSASMIVDADGNLIVVSASSGTTVVSKFNELNGVRLWSRTIRNFAPDYIYRPTPFSLAVDEANDFYFGGYGHGMKLAGTTGKTLFQSVFQGSPSGPYGLIVTDDSVYFGLSTRETSGTTLAKTHIAKFDKYQVQVFK